MTAGMHKEMIKMPSLSHGKEEMDRLRAGVGEKFMKYSYLKKKYTY